MKFRPCIDIHNGKVKQIVGGSLRDEGNQANTNFTSELDAAWYAGLYQKDRLKGGHIILLNPEGSEYYEETKRQALEALPGLSAGNADRRRNYGGQCSRISGSRGEPRDRNFLCLPGWQVSERES